MRYVQAPAPEQPEQPVDLPIEVKRYREMLRHVRRQQRLNERRDKRTSEFVSREMPKGHPHAGALGTYPCIERAMSGTAAPYCGHLQAKSRRDPGGADIDPTWPRTSRPRSSARAPRSSDFTCRRERRDVRRLGVALGASFGLATHHGAETVDTQAQRER